MCSDSFLRKIIFSCTTSGGRSWLTKAFEFTVFSEYQVEIYDRTTFYQPAQGKIAKLLMMMNFSLIKFFPTINSQRYQLTRKSSFFQSKFHHLPRFLLLSFFLRENIFNKLLILMGGWCSGERKAHKIHFNDGVFAVKYIFATLLVSRES